MGKAGVSWVKFTFTVQVVYRNAHSYLAALIQNEFMLILLAWAPFTNLKREAMFAPFTSAVCCGNSPQTGACGRAKLEKRTQAKAALVPRVKAKPDGPLAPNRKAQHTR